MSSPETPNGVTNTDWLTARVLPQMTLSKMITEDHHEKECLTGPPPPVPHYLTSEGRARLRFDVEGNAIVTGGAGTLGYEAAKALLEHGLKGLMIWDYDEFLMESRVDELKDEFPTANIQAIKLDVTDEDEVATAIEDSMLMLGSIDILLCFAGTVDCTHAIDMSAASFRRTLDINTTGTFICAQAVAKKMIHQETGGSIVFIASISGHRVNFPQPQVAYNVSKAALLTMKNCLAAEWARYGIRVNSISPGYMDTILNEGPGLEDARKIWNERNPTGRMGLPQELTGAVVLLASNASTYMIGTDIVVDGGQILF